MTVDYSLLMGYGIDFDGDQAECRICGELFTPDTTCACCQRCGGRGSLVSGLGAGNGTTRVTCSACEGTGRAQVEDESAAIQEAA
jgi:DnaJ-class molecular chaperone